jgi:hypothetical protein
MGRIGASRKRAFFLRQIAILFQNLDSNAGLSDLWVEVCKGYQVLFQKEVESTPAIVRGKWGVTASHRRAGPRKIDIGWPLLQVHVLKEAVAISDGSGKS